MTSYISRRPMCAAIVTGQVALGLSASAANDHCLCGVAPEWGRLVAVPEPCPDLGPSKAAQIMRMLDLPNCVILDFPVSAPRTGVFINSTSTSQLETRDLDPAAFSLTRRKPGDREWQIIYEEPMAQSYREERRRRGLDPIAAPPISEVHRRFTFQLAASAKEAIQYDYRIEMIRPTGDALCVIPFGIHLESLCKAEGMLQSGPDIERRIVELVSLNCSPIDGRQAAIELIQRAPIAEHSIRVVGKVVFLNAEGDEISWGYVEGHFAGEDYPWEQSPNAKISITGLGLPRDQIAASATAIVLQSTCEDVAASLRPYQSDWWCGKVVIDMLK